MDLNLSRREALGVLGAVGALATVAQAPLGGASKADHVEVRRFVTRAGVQGKMTGAQAAASALACESVRCVFGVPGAQNNELWDAFKARRVPYLLVTNEQSSSVMADASARVTGEVGVFSVVPGPGLTNAMTGIGEALLDSVPIVGILTDIDRAPGAPVGQVHSLPTAALVRPIVKCLFEVRHPSEIPGAIHQAFRVARSGEPGPVAVVIPYPFLMQSWDFDEGVPPYPVPFDDSVYPNVLGHLSNKKCQVGIYAGAGCIPAGPALTAVAELLQAPVATSVSGKGVIPDGHPLAVGWGYGKQGTRAAERAFKEVDVVLAVGVKYSEVSTANYAIPKHDMLIHVDANPHNLGRNVPAHIKLCADSQVFFNRLLSDGAAIQREPNPKLIRTIQDYRARDQQENITRPQITSAVDPMLFYTTLRASLGPEELIFVDVTASTHWASEAISVAGPRRYFTPSNNQSMGWAIPAAIGAQRVRMDRLVVSVTGDGCFLMSAIETSTAARAGLPVKFFVFDDGAYHYMQMLQEPVYRRTTATELAKIDYAAFAQAMGLSFNQIPCNADLPGGIARALCTPGPVLTHVRISYDGRELRWLSALRSTYLKRLPTDQKIRMASRVGMRTGPRPGDSD